MTDKKKLIQKARPDPKGSGRELVRTSPLFETSAASYDPPNVEHPKNKSRAVETKRGNPPSPVSLKKREEE